MTKRIVLIVSQHRERIADLLPEFRDWLGQRTRIVAELDARGDDALPDVIKDADLAVVLGGDGTILSQSRRLVDLEIPLLGVNVGRLGFLSEFDLASLKLQENMIFGDYPLQYRERIMIESRIERSPPDGAQEASPTRAGDTQLALNDCVITAGPPFRMIELGLELDGEPTPYLQGDGLIISTPIGSTGHSVSAGGAIVSPELDCLAITPIAAHSLAFRPLVVSSTCKIAVTVRRANPGTTLVLDGQNHVPLQKGDRIVVRKYHKRVKLVANPRGNYWRTLVRKLHWAEPPRPD